jgi:hypothetical protein
MLNTLPLIEAVFLSRPWGLTELSIEEHTSLMFDCVPKPRYSNRIIRLIHLIGRATSGSWRVGDIDLVASLSVLEIPFDGTGLPKPSDLRCGRLPVPNGRSVTMTEAEAGWLAEATLDCKALRDAILERTRAPHDYLADAAAYAAMIETSGNPADIVVLRLPLAS